MAEMSPFGLMMSLGCLELTGHPREEENLEYKSACGLAQPAMGSY